MRSSRSSQHVDESCNINLTANSIATKDRLANRQNAVQLTLIGGIGGSCVGSTMTMSVNRGLCNADARVKEEAGISQKPHQTSDKPSIT